MSLAPTPQDKSSGFAHEQWEPRSGMGESANAAMELSALDTATNSLIRMKQLHDLENPYDTKLTSEELNEKFPGLENPFTESKSLRVAQQIYDNHIKRTQLENIVKAGPQNTGQTLLNFVAGIIPHTIDPLEIGAGLATGYAFNAIAAGTSVGSAIARNTVMKTAFGAGNAIKNTGQIIARDAVEGFVGNIVTEPISTIPVAGMEQRQYGLADAGYNAALGAFGFAAIKGVGSKAIRFMRNKNEAALKLQDRTASAQLLNDQKVDVAPTTEMVNKLTDIPHAKNGYEHSQIIDNTDMSQRTWSAPKDAVIKSIDGDNAMMTDFYGSGVYISDNPAVADAASGSGLSAHTGSVIDVKLKEDANIINIDEPSVDPKFNEALAMAIEKTGLSSIEATDVSVRQFFDMLVEANVDKDFDNFMDVLGQEVQARGIDGYRFVADSVGGTPHSPHNAMVVFNQDKLVTGESRTPGPDSARASTQEEMQKIREAQDPVTGHRDYNPENIKKLDSHIENPQVSEVKPAEISNLADNIIEDLKMAEEQGRLSPEDKKALEILVKETKAATDLETIAKQVIVCVR